MPVYHVAEEGGTPAYMAPEQARGDTVDGRADLFSLGCVLYRMATGRLPFVGRTAMQTLKMSATAEPTPLEELNPHLPPALCDLLRRLMAKAPTNRPASARVVAQELAAIERDPTPPSVPQTKRRRSRGWALAAGAAILGLIGCVWLAALVVGRREREVTPVTDIAVSRSESTPSTTRASAPETPCSSRRARPGAGRRWARWSPSCWPTRVGW